MKHKEKYYEILGLGLIISGVVIIVFGLWYGYNIFTGRMDIPAILERGQNVTQSLSIGNAHTGETTIGLPSSFVQNAWRTGDVTIQYLFVLLIFSGGARIAKLGIETLRSRVSPKEDKV